MEFGAVVVTPDPPSELEVVRVSGSVVVVVGSEHISLSNRLNTRGRPARRVPAEGREFEGDELPT